MLDRLEWTPLSREESGDLLARVLFGGDRAPLESLARRGRRADLPFYPAVHLAEVTILGTEHVAPVPIFVLAGQKGTYYLDGTSSPIHLCNSAEGIRLDEETAADYLRFFCFAVRGDEGAFRLVEEPPAAVPAVADVVKPVEALEPDEEGRFRFGAFMEYAGDLSRVWFSVDREGLVVMENDEPVAGDLPDDAFEPLPALRPAAAVAALVRPPIPGGRPGDDTLTILVRLLLERALARETRSRLLSHFNEQFSKSSGLEGFARMLGTAWTVIAIESSLPFVEATVVDIVRDLLPEPGIRRFAATAMPGDDTMLVVDIPEGPAIGVLPYHVYRGIFDIERVAHQIGSREVTCLIGCERVPDLPASLREVLDLTLVLPRMDEDLFEALFRRMTGDEPPADWRDGDTRWLGHVHHSDFQHPAGLGLSPEETVEFVRERAMDRLRDVEPVSGLELSQLHGLGEARLFAEDLITDIHEALAGRLDWMHVDRGMLLVGDPGTGKTTLARAIAKACGIRFISASAAGWQSAGHLGDHIRAIRTDFARARRFAPSILFIDELDSIGNRETFAGENAQYLTEVVNALLEQIQGMDPEAPVIVIGATNFEANVDPALERAGRLDRVVRIPRPNVKALGRIYAGYLDEYVGSDRAADVDPAALAGLSLGLTGADVERNVRGALRRARRAGREIRQEDLVAEITRKPRDPDAAHRLTPDEVCRVAVHEAGHALASCLDSSGGEEITFVTVVPRSDGTLGFVARLPSDRAFFTRAEYLERLEVFLAGRAAEEIVFGSERLTGGAGGPSTSSDLAVATRAAVQIVTRYGLGPGDGLLWTDVPGPEHLEQADRLLRDAYDRIRDKLTQRRGSLDAIADALVDRQEMTGGEIREIVAGRAGTDGRA